MKTIPEEMRLTLTRQFKGKQWNLCKVLESFRAEVTAIEQIQLMNPPNMSMNRPKPNFGPQPATASTLFLSNRNSTCTYCKDGHSSNNCQVVTSISARKEFLEVKERCFNCLRVGHTGKNCPAENRCRNCPGRHHISICLRNEQRLQQQFRRQPLTAPSTATSAGNCFSVSVNPSQAMQGTPVIQGLPVMLGPPIIQGKPVEQEQPIAQGEGMLTFTPNKKIKGPTSMFQ